MTPQWWGEPPSYDPRPTINYMRQALDDACARYGCDRTRLVLAGFSRGALAVNYIGLHDMETASLWAAMIAFSHYDGVNRRALRTTRAT